MWFNHNTTTTVGQLTFCQLTQHSTTTNKHNHTINNMIRPRTSLSSQDDDYHYLMVKIPKTSDAKVEKLKSIFDKVAEEAILIESDDEEQDFVFYRAKSKSQDSAVVTPASQVQVTTEEEEQEKERDEDGSQESQVQTSEDEEDEEEPQNKDDDSSTTFTPPAEEEEEEEEEEEIPKQKKNARGRSKAKKPVDLKKLTVSLCQQLNKLTRVMPGNIVIDLQFGFEHFQVELGEQIKAFKKVNTQSQVLSAAFFPAGAFLRNLPLTQWMSLSTQSFEPRSSPLLFLMLTERWVST